jgi:hypothetical protein
MLSRGCHSTEGIVTAGVWAGRAGRVLGDASERSRVNLEFTSFPEKILPDAKTKKHEFRRGIIANSNHAASVHLVSSKTAFHWHDQ